MRGIVEGVDDPGLATDDVVPDRFARAGRETRRRHDDDLVPQGIGDHRRADRAPLQCRENLALGEGIDELGDAVADGTAGFEAKQVLVLAERLGVAVGIQDTLDLTGPGIPDVASHAAHQRHDRVADEVVLAGVLRSEPVETLVRPIEEGNQLQEIGEGEGFEIFPRDRQLASEALLERLCLAGSFEQVLADIEPHAVAFLRQPPALRRAVGIGLVG